MKNIYILEKFNFTDEHKEKLNKLGNVHYYDKASENEIKEIVPKADVILLDWIDPTPILPLMKKGSFICLPYTGYEWITNLKHEIQRGIIASNTPNYSTNAVAEHHLALILAATKSIVNFNNQFKARGGVVEHKPSIELKGKTIGIIGLGHIGSRLAELLQPFKVELLTYNRTIKRREGIKDVTLDELLKNSDIICVCCQLNPQTKKMISTEQFKIMKTNSILTSTTSGIIDLNKLAKIIDDKFFAVGLDDVDQEKVPEKLIHSDKLTCTYHRAYETNESENNRINICIDNIKAYLERKQINKVDVES